MYTRKILLDSERILITYPVVEDMPLFIESRQAKLYHSCQHMLVGGAAYNEEIIKMAHPSNLDKIERTYSIISKDDGRYLGNITYTDDDDIYVYLLPKETRKGYGTEAIKSFCNHFLFNIPGIEFVFFPYTSFENPEVFQKLLIKLRNIMGKPRMVYKMRTDTMIVIAKY